MNEDRKELLQNAVILVVFTVLAVRFWDTFKVPVMFVVTLGILVAIHEWGHFIAAKSVGVRVYEFALGFGPKLITYMRRGGTEYTIRALPIGGFVNPKGMQPDDPITSDGINGRRPAERALVYLAGPLMNMILTIFVLCLSGFLLGDTDETKVLVGQVDKKKPAALMGLKVGDEVLEVNGKPVTGAETVLDAIHPNVGKSITLKVRRRDQELSLTGAAEARTIEGDFLVVTQAPASSGLPVQAGDQLDKVDGKRVETLAGKGEAPDAAVERVLREKAGQPVTLTVWREGKTRLELRGPAAPLEVSAQAGKRTIGALGFGPLPGQGPPLSLEKSVSNGIERLGTLSQGLLSMFSRPKQLSQNLGGVISIYALLGGAVNLPPMYYLSIIAQLSLSLAVFNLLPIFLLDGGHLLILTIEVLRRKRLDPEMHKRAAMVGMAIIGVLFVWIMTKDILRHWL